MKCFEHLSYACNKKNLVKKAWIIFHFFPLFSKALKSEKNFFLKNFISLIPEKIPPPWPLRFRLRSFTFPSRYILQNSVQLVNPRYFCTVFIILFYFSCPNGFDNSNPYDLLIKNPGFCEMGHHICRLLKK